MKFLNKQGPDSAEMPFLDHLEELRWRLLWSLLSLLVGAVIGFFIVVKLDVFNWLLAPVMPYLPDGKVVTFGPMEPFFIKIKLALTVGLLLAFPIIVYQVWAFVAPALHPREKRLIVPSLYLGLLLFAGGVAMAYYLVMPITLEFGQSFADEATMTNLVAAGPFLGLMVKVLIGFGAVFELPVVVLVLSGLGLVTSKFLREKRRYAFAGSAILAAMLTPGDVLSVTVFMMGPLVVLYEMSIGLARIMEKRRARMLMADPLPEAS